MISFRLGGTDGVAVAAARWMRILASQGWDVVTVAGEGPVDRLVPGLAMEAPAPPEAGEVEEALSDVDVTIVENLLTIPLNLPASRAVAGALAGRPALLHHHDPPWQRARFIHVEALPPDDPAWVHVAINRLTQTQFAERGIAAEMIYNAFDVHEPPGDRESQRAELLAGLGLDADPVVVAHPVRAIERKNVPLAVAFSDRIRTVLDRPVVYWLPGPAEEDYAPTLARIERDSTLPFLRMAPRSMPDLYAAADLVVFPSTWEGFGNPPVEAAIHGRPAVVGDYPVAAELRDLGFRWYGVEDVGPVAGLLAEPDAYAEAAAHNAQVASTYLSMDVVGEQLKNLFEATGWWP